MPIVPSEQFPFCGPTYGGLLSGLGGSSPVFNSERCVNFYPEPAGKDGHPKSRAQLIGRPGLALFATLPLSPVRALAAGNNRLFAVGGTHVYELAQNGTVLTDFGAMATSSGTGLCQMVLNGNQLLVMDPSIASGGTINGGIFFVNPVGPVVTNVFSGGALTYMDGFFFAINSSAGLPYPSRVNVSDLLDGSTAGNWNALNFANRTGHADALIQLEELNQQLWWFGTKTIEVWWNAGNPTFPLIRAATINLGLLSRFSVVKFYNTLLWIGSDDRGYAVVYLANGLNPMRVSTPAIEYLLNNSGSQSALTSTAYGYQEAGHTFYCINFGSANNYANTQGLTLCYDLSTGLWHERTSLIGGNQGMHLPQCVACVPDFSTNPAATGSTFVGDANSGKIFVQSLSYKSDAGAAITYVRRSPHASSKNRWIKYSSLEIDADIGTAQMQLDYSNDGGRTFPLAHRRGPVSASTTQAYGSAGGGFGRFKFWQLGRSRDRVFQMSITDSANHPRIVDAFLNAAGGAEP